MVSANLVHIVVGPGGDTWERQKTKVVGKAKHNILASVGTNKYFPQTQKRKTKMTALARSIDLEDRWIHFH